MLAVGEYVELTGLLGGAFRHTAGTATLAPPQARP